MSDEINDAIHAARLRGTHLEQPPTGTPPDAPEFNGGARTPAPVAAAPASMNQLMRAHKLARRMSGGRGAAPTPADFESALDHYRTTD